jgi:tRNA A-37 threonylcarbamoyl transferase component Bud32
MTGEKIFETKSSVMLRVENGDVLKCLKLRHWTEYHKLLLGKNRALEEVVSNYKMKSLGLNVPEVKYFGIFSNVFSKREFTSFYAMESINSDYQPGNIVFQGLIGRAKENFIKKISIDISKLRDSNYVYSDLSLRNVLVNDLGDYYWIDTQIKGYSRKEKFKNKFNHSLRRFISDEDLIISDQDKKDLLIKLLAV